MIRYATFLLIMALTLIGHAMIRVMGSATFDGRFHGSWTAVLLQEPAKPKSNKELAGELVRQLSTGIAEMTNLSRSVRNASAMQQELLQALGSHQLTDGYGDGPHRTASWLPERVLADEARLGAGLAHLDSSLSALDGLATSARFVLGELSYLRAQLGDTKMGRLLGGDESVDLGAEPAAHDDEDGEGAGGALSLPRWAVEGEEKKAGAGCLFFAYGGAQLDHFLQEATTAARTFRVHNPALPLAVVTNNATVDAAFTHHIRPRHDLLFPGDTSNGGQNRADGFPRQWLTRLYYMAHSPFQITWALDSNVVTCAGRLGSNGWRDRTTATRLLTRCGARVGAGAPRLPLRPFSRRRYTRSCGASTWRMRARVASAPCTRTTSTSSTDGARPPPRSSVIGCSCRPLSACVTSSCSSWPS